MGPSNQNTTKAPTHASSSEQVDNTKKLVDDVKKAVKKHRKNKKSSKRAERTSSKMSTSSNSCKLHSPSSHPQRIDQMVEVIAHHIKDEYQCHDSITDSNSKDYGAFSGYGDIQFSVDGAHDKSIDMYHQRRQGRVRRQTVRLPDQSTTTRQIRHRLPTPEPDILERIYICRQRSEIIEEIIEEPTTPPPRVQERTVIEQTGPPKVLRKMIRVPPRSQNYQYEQQETLSNYGSFSGVSAPTAGSGAFGAGYGQSGQGYNTNGDYYRSSNLIGIAQHGPQSYGQSGYQRYQEPLQQVLADIQFNYNASNAQGLTNSNGGSFQTVVPPVNISQNAFCFQRDNVGSPTSCLQPPSLSNYGAIPQHFTDSTGAETLGEQGYGRVNLNFGSTSNFGAESDLGVATRLGAAPQFSTGPYTTNAPTFGGTCADGIRNFSSSHFGSGTLDYGGGFGGGQMSNPDTYASGTCLGNASSDVPIAVNNGAQTNLFASGFSSSSMANFGGCGGMSGGLGGYGSLMGGLSMFGSGGSFGGGASFGGGFPFAGGASFGGGNPCLPSPPPMQCTPPTVIQVPCPVPVPVPQPQPCPYPVPVAQPQPCLVPVPVREYVSVP